MIRINGHNIKQIEFALKQVETIKNKPHMIIADTLKGKGISFMENKPEWHAKPLNNAEYEIACKELNQMGEKG